MQFVILAYESPDDFAQRETKGRDNAAFAAYMEPWGAFSAKLGEAGVIRGGGALCPPEAATTISLKDGAKRIEDGPFLDAKEQLGGYFLIDVASMKEAVDWAAQCPTTKTGYTEIYPIPTYAADA